MRSSKTSLESLTVNISFIKATFLIGNWKKNLVFQNLNKQQKFYEFFSYKITPRFNFLPKNDGVVDIFSFLLLRPCKTFKVLKKGPNFGFLTLNYA